MKKKPLPRYVKCIKVWYGTGGDSTIGKVYDTNRSPNFSQHPWEELLVYGYGHFIQCNENGQTVDEQTVNEQFKFFL